MSLFNQVIKRNLTANLVRLSLYLILAALISCSSEQAKLKVYSAPLKNEIVFDCFSINHAWGYQMSGFFIDSNGMVYRYKRKGTAWHPKPVLLEKQRYYDEQDLLSKFTNKSLAARIDATILQSKINMIDIADSGSVSHLKQKVADAGQNLCLAYRYGKEKNLYRPVALGSYGVTEKTIVNNSAAAQSLLKWLMNDVANGITGAPRFKGLSNQTE